MEFLYGAILSAPHTPCNEAEHFLHLINAPRLR